MDFKNLDLTKFTKERMLIMEHPELDDLAEEVRDSLFKEYITLLVNKKVVSANGNVEPDRYGCYNYISDVIPFLSKEEIMLLQTNPNQFGFRFMFSASFSKSESSFACWLQNEGILADRTFEPIDPLFDMDDVFNEFTAVTGRSPFERFEKTGSAEFFREYVERDVDLNDFGLEDEF